MNDYIGRALVGCELSGIVRDALAARGWDAWSCDLEPCERGGKHYQGDVRDLFGEPFDLFIVHPPCTRLTNSGVRWLAERDLWGEMREAAEFFKTCLNAPFPRVGAENPIMHKYAREIVGVKYAQIIQPWQFGHAETKATCLWLRNLPPLEPTKIMEPRLFCCGVELENRDKYGCANCNGDKKPVARWDNQTPSGQNKLPPSPERARLRSYTYQGIADAMADQWTKNYLKEVKK